MVKGDIQLEFALLTEPWHPNSVQPEHPAPCLGVHRSLNQTWLQCKIRIPRLASEAG